MQQRSGELLKVRWKSVSASKGDVRIEINGYMRFGSGQRICSEGKIFIESQGMCIMAGIGLEDGRARLALDSVKERLDCDYGIVLNNPAFSSYIVKYGEISSYPEGYKENAGIFCHNNPWIMIAETLSGNGNAAWDYFRSPMQLINIRSGGLGIFVQRGYAMYKPSILLVGAIPVAIRESPGQ